MKLHKTDNVNTQVNRSLNIQGQATYYNLPKIHPKIEHDSIHDAFSPFSNSKFEPRPNTHH